MAEQAEDRAGSEPGEARRRGRPVPPLAFVLLLIALPTLVFSNTFHNSWLLDDGFRIVGNHHLDRVWPPWRHFLDASTMATLPGLIDYRPMMPLTISINHWVSDRLGVERRVGLHVGNLAIHLLSVLLLWLLLRELLALGAPPTVPERLRDAAAFFAALIWGLHPISGMPVNYMAARDLVLMQAFSLGAFLVWVRMRRRGSTPLGWIAVAGLFALAYLSKQNAVGVVGAILAFELLLAPGRSMRTFALGGAFAGLAVLFIVFMTGDRFIRTMSIPYLVIQMKVHLWHYLPSLVWPFELRLLPHIENPDGWLDPAVLSGIAFIALSLLLAFRWRSRWPLAAFCILAYWALLAPTSSVVATREMANDYRPYPALAPLCLLGVAFLFARLRAVPAVVIASLVAVYLGVASRSMNELYRDERTYWTHVVRHGGNGTAILSLARTYEDDDPARSQALLEQAMERDPNHILVHINLGVLRMRDGRIEEGLGLVERAVELDPDMALSVHYLARVYASQGMVPEALEASRRAAELDPGNAEYQLRAAYQLEQAGQFDEALEYLWRVRDDDPLYWRRLFLEGLAYQGLGDPVQAEDRFVRTLELEPTDAWSHYHLGVARMSRGLLAEAIASFEAVVEQGEGPVAMAHRRLSVCHTTLGDPEAAQRHAEAARQGGQVPQ